MKEERPSPQNIHSNDLQATEKQAIQEEKQQQASLEEVADVNALQKAEEALVEANDKYLRLYAEFENFRKRATKEKLRVIETANEHILKQILPIADDFERAILAMQQPNQDQGTASIKQGIQLIHDKFMHLLQQANVRAMDAQVGSEFDAELHEAVTQIPAEEALKGKIVEVLERGYYLKDQVLRFAKVVIGS